MCVCSFCIPSAFSQITSGVGVRVTSRGSRIEGVVLVCFVEDACHRVVAAIAVSCTRAHRCVVAKAVHEMAALEHCVSIARNGDAEVVLKRDVRPRSRFQSKKVDAKPPIRQGLHLGPG